MIFLAHIFVTGVIFVLIDAIWIAVVANSFYKDQMGKLLADKPKLFPAAVFYLIYLWAVLYFVIEPALINPGWEQLLKNAGLLGFAMYATYDLTNAATLKKWPLKLTVVDMLWGTTLTVAVSAASYFIFNR